MGGPFWNYVATPQPGNLVLAKVCRTCGKRAKWNIHIETRVTVRQRRTRSCDQRLATTGEVGFRVIREGLGRPRITNRTITLCCSDSEEVLGTVVRTCWTKHRDGTHSKFWLIVRRRDTGRVHWATLGTCRVVDSVEALARLATQEGDDARA